MEGKVTLLVQALPGLRLFDGKDPEEGSIIAFRKEGDECLYVSHEGEEGKEKGMEWIPVSQFSVDPEAVTPLEILDGLPGDEPVGGEEPTPDRGAPREVPTRKSPFGGRQLKRRQQSEG